MTTRGQKRTNDASQSNTSDNGTILNLLTGIEPVMISVENNPEIVPVEQTSTKDVSKETSDDPAIAKEHTLQLKQATVPATPEIPSERSRNIRNDFVLKTEYND